MRPWDPSLVACDSVLSRGGGEEDQEGPYASLCSGREGSGQPQRCICVFRGFVSPDNPPLPRGFYFPEGRTLPTEVLMQYLQLLWEHSRAIGESYRIRRVGV